MPTYYPVIPPFPTYPPVQTNAVSTGTFSGTYGTYSSSSSNGPSPQCLDSGWAKKNVISSMMASVTGPLDGTANVGTMASYGVDVPNLSSYTTKQALALAVGAPKRGDITTALGGNSELNALFTTGGSKATFGSDCYKFVIGGLGGRYNVGGRRTTETQNAQIAFTLNTPLPPTVTVGDLYVGLYNIQCFDFQSLTLTISKGGVSQTIGTYLNCNAFRSALQNKSISIGPLTGTGIPQPLPIKIAISEVVSPSKGSGVYFNFMVVDPLSTSKDDAASPGNGSPSILAQKSQQNAGVHSDHGAAGQPSQTSSAVADFGPGFVVMGCSALLAILMRAGLLKLRKPVKAI